MKDPTINLIVLIFLYMLSFLLVREWLVLLTSLTETGYLTVFLLFVGLSFILYLLAVKWPVAITIKFLYIVWAIQFIYLKVETFSIETFPFMINALLGDVSIIAAGHFMGISNVSRTLMFFLFIWMLVYLIRYWIEVKQRITFFYFTTIVLVATADTFSAYSAENSIFLLMIIGLLLLGLLMFLRLNLKHGQAVSISKLRPLTVPLIFLLMLSSVLISFLPKLAPVWADPVPFLKAVVDDKMEGQPTVSKSGYDPNDTHLGGPFIQDDSLVFEATVDERNYWKVETKDTYTSKGWEQSEEDRLPREILFGQQVTDEPVLSGALSYAELSLVEEFPFVIHPYGVQMIDSPSDVDIYYDQLMDKYKTEKNDKPFALATYQMAFHGPLYSLQQLRETSVNQLMITKDLERYLQLPDSLPMRVEDLAESITASSDSVYEKAKAIERYFSGNGFTYERTNVAIPAGEEDYVDQFLFDTKKGYCDNFSSSMVVMLRTMGIPARWVKGFAPGQSTINEDGNQIYRVSNNEAHSWVEAYVPDIGWVPFEPTIGFSGVADIDYDVELSMDDPEVEEMPEDVREEFEREQIVKEELEELEQKPIEEVQVSPGKWLKLPGYGWLLFGIMLGAIILIVYATRKKWIGPFLLRRYSVKGGSRQTFYIQYKQLLKQLNRTGLKRGSSETLSAYARRVEEHFGNNHFQQLTDVYEKGIYGGSEEEEDWQKLQEMWKDLIKRTSD